MSRNQIAHREKTLFSVSIHVYPCINVYTRVILHITANLADCFWGGRGVIILRRVSSTGLERPDCDGFVHRFLNVVAVLAGALLLRFGESSIRHVLLKSSISDPAAW